MADIKRAVEREEEYLAHRARGEEPFHLVDAVRECGFSTLEDYFEAKRSQEFGRIEFGFAEVQPSEAIPEIFRLMDAGEAKLLFVPSTDTFVFAGESKPFDKAYCEENGIPIYPLHTKGGCIVSTAGDFSVVVTYPETEGCGVRFILDKLAGILGGYMPDVEFAGNDILVNGRKVCGSVEYRQGGMRAFAAHFSFNDNSELIENICGVSGSVKEPAAISGLTVALFREAVRMWLRVRSI